MERKNIEDCDIDDLGTYTDFDQLATLEALHWRRAFDDNSSIYRCLKHGTIFDYDEEPCLECYNSCVHKVLPQRSMKSK